jgi:hypothetical protein
MRQEVMQLNLDKPSENGKKTEDSDKSTERSIPSERQSRELEESTRNISTGRPLGSSKPSGSTELLRRSSVIITAHMVQANQSQLPKSGKKVQQMPIKDALLLLLALVLILSVI